ncbi:hypothetical protein [Desulfobulbus sp.]|uniref:hypothetical protein n=1 Tax=Desulfobulbus sp. TaxID=895 RepID=UPI00286EC2EF|nr:hypothetical protein [Desulfobulbus sp.]
MKIANRLSNKFEEHTELIKALCDCFDSGNEIVAVSIATAIRVLVHDTGSSTSLLTHLERKKGQFLNTNFRNPRESVHLGLVRRINVGVNDGQGGEAKYWPLCDERYFSTPKEHFTFVPFDDWWGYRVFENQKFYLTRKDLVLAIVNKDGGAHFDKEVEDNYDTFRKSWSGGSSLVGRQSEEVRGYDNIPIYPAVRQMGYELLHSKL